VRNRPLDFFSTVKTEGAMLPPEILVRIAEMDIEMGGLTPDVYHLDKGEKINEAINRSWNRLLGVWGAFRKAQEVLPQEDTGTSITREKWLLKLFDELGYGRLLPSKPMDVEGKIYPVSHFWQHTPIHLIGFRADLDKSLAHHTGAYRYKPHSMVQEFLNRTEGHLWAFLSNGLRLRILRDNTSLVRQAYVEFDLEAMMDGGIFPDFKLLWLLCHQSRVEADRPEDCWLENWTRVTQAVGTRAREDLRNGVQRAIEALGVGFLAHPANEPLREDLRAGRLDKQDYYRELLRFVYQLIFLFVAEDRDLLAPPSTTPEAKNRYLRYYSTTRLRVLAGRKAGTRHDDLYRVIRLVIDSLGEGEGRKELGIPILNSSLFSMLATPSLRKYLITNMDYLEAIRALAITSDRHGRRPTDYRNLGSEELGSVYESLLELHPDVNIEAKTFSLKTATGSERKTTGSYYTPTSLITCLLDTALDPVLDEAEGKENPEKAILELKVCDPACGSGHFLIAAAQRIAGRVASIRAGGEEPPTDLYRRALRDVIGRCVYGVDINPMSVELCKVSLWMEALEPGKPLSFLDHHIRVGNSLLGATPELIAAGLPNDAFTAIEGDDKKACAVLKKRNKAERKGIGPLFTQQDAETQSRLEQAAATLEDLPDDRPEDIRAKDLAFRRHEQNEEYRQKKQFADAWCATFVIRKYFRESGREASVSGITQGHLNDFAAGRPLPADLAAEVERLSGQYHFFHWHLAFPEVFARGGFDCVFGNPPWERVKLQEKEWFAERRPEIASAPTAAARKRLIKSLRIEDPSLDAHFKEASRNAEGESHLMRHSGLYPLCGRGDINVYAVFCERMHCLLSPVGRVGCVVPTGIATDDTTKEFFQQIVRDRTLHLITGFINEEMLFPSVLHNFKFCILTITGHDRTVDHPDFVFNCYRTADIKEIERHFTLTAEEIQLLNPNTGTCPVFLSGKSAEITKHIYRRTPILDGGRSDSHWGIRFVRMFDMSNDSSLFSVTHTAEMLPVYEAKMMNQFNHRFASYGSLQEGERSHMLPETELKVLQDPTSTVSSCYYATKNEVEERIKSVENRGWLIGFRGIASAGLARTIAYAFLPICGASNSMPIVAMPKTILNYAACFVGCMNSFVLDFVARQKLAGPNLNFFIKRQLAVPSRLVFDSNCSWSPLEITKSWIDKRVLELTYTTWDLQSFAQSYAHLGAPFRWDEERRFLLRCEQDAAFFHLYLPAESNGDWRPAEGETAEDLPRLKAIFPIPRDAVAYIMDTFPIVKRRDEEKYGAYRTKDTILEIYDAMIDAIRTGKPYQTRLDPPPADPRCCHPARERSAL